MEFVSKAVDPAGYRAYQNNWWRQDKRRRKHHLKSNYGLTLEDFDRMVEEQEGKCYLCKKERPLLVDHCHASGKVRGLLCRGCNSCLGWFERHRDKILDYVE